MEDAKAGLIYCPVCKKATHLVKVGAHPDLELIDTKGDIYYCNNCAFGFVYPTPDVKDLEKYYVKQYRDIRKEKVSEAYLAGALIRSSAHVALLSKYIASFENLNVLEIGSGIGTTLKLLNEKGAKVTGYEADNSFAEYSKKYVPGALIHNQYFDEKHATEKYDLITMSHVLEHMLNPYDFLISLKKNLTDKGLIFIEVPNETLATVKALVKRKLVGDMHLNFFSKGSLASFFSKDFDIIFNQTCGMKHKYHPHTIKPYRKRRPLATDITVYSPDAERIWSRIIYQIKSN